MKNKEIWVGIHPGINAEFNVARQWPIAHFANLLDKILAKSNTKVVLFGKGTSEGKAIRFLFNQHEHRCLPVLDCQLDEVTAYISMCDVFLGNDSGLMNLAIGLGVPTLGILGPTDPRHTGPYGKQHKVVRLDLQCSPCFDQGKSLECSHRRCMTELKPDRVLAALQDLLASRK